MTGVNVHIEEQCGIRADRKNNATPIVLVLVWFQDSVRKGQVMSYVLKGVCEKKQDMTMWIAKNSPLSVLSII